MDDCASLRARVKETLKEEAPVNILKGNTIAPGHSQELDELRAISKSGKTYLDDMLNQRVCAPGIPSLKIASNNVFGYYIEVRNTHKDKVPESWLENRPWLMQSGILRKNLKNTKSKILGAEERIAIEQQQFT
jgi:DNA mismatch repair protein MutS